MSSGTPIVMKCPKCKRGEHGRDRRVLGCHATGEVENVIRRSKHQGHGKGGSGFTGYRGLAECRDCGHRWFSTHPGSGRKSASDARRESKHL